mmetsp:Transcript_30994/g.48309  ORF Transcript_30994/g.48309 Transcript_30994/m.48309 type:complete len:110 (+) Transcript_30994:575-904(+)
MSQLLSVGIGIFSFLLSIGVKEYMSITVLLAFITIMWQVWSYRYTLSWTVVLMGVFKAFLVPSLLPILSWLLWARGRSESLALVSIADSVQDGGVPDSNSLSLIFHQWS